MNLPFINQTPFSIRRYYHAIRQFFHRSLDANHHWNPKTDSDYGRL
jgi:hypothetical protein